MLTPKSILGFALRAAVIYAVLMALWPLTQHVYSPCVRAVANAVFDSFGSGGHAEFRALPQPEGNSDTRVVCTNRRSPGWQDDELLMSIRYKAYVPNVTITALVLATAVPWRRRLLALGLGWLLGHVFVVARLAVSLLNKFSYDNPIQAFELGPTARDVLLYVRDAISGSIFMCSFGIPALIWILVSFRRSDWQRLLATRDPQPGQRPG